MRSEFLPVGVLGSWPKAYIHLFNKYWPAYSVPLHATSLKINFYFLLSFYFIFFYHFFKFYFIFKLYIIVLVLPNIKMNPPQVYMCSRCHFKLLNLSFPESSAWHFNIPALEYITTKWLPLKHGLLMSYNYSLVPIESSSNYSAWLSGL